MLEIMKKNIMRSVLTAILATMSIGAWADGRVAIADMANGKIEVVGDVAASGQATVTLKVTPNADYYIISKSSNHILLKSGLCSNILF